VLELESILRKAAQCAGDERPVVAAPYDLADLTCRDLAAEGVFSGYIANSAPDSSDRNPFVAGWWIDRRMGLWHIRYGIASTVVLLGAATHQAVCMKLVREARRKGVRRLLVVDGNGSVLQDLDIRSIPVRRKPSVQASRQLGDFCYEAAFDKIFANVGKRLQVPAERFAPKRILLIVGSLGPGGAERQASYIAAGLARRRTYDMYVGCNFVDQPPANLFKPMVEAAGARVRRVVHPMPEYDMAATIAARRRLGPYDALGAQNIFYAILEYASMIRRICPAIVHTWTDYSNVFGGIAAELAGVPALVLSGRSVAPDNFPALFQPYMRPGYLALLQRRNVLFLNNSRAGAADYARWLELANDEIQVIHNGFDFQHKAEPGDREAIRSAYDFPPVSPVVGSIMRFSEEKRPQLFIDVARILHRSHPHLRFLVFGEGPMREEMRAYAASCGLSGVLQLPGLTSDAWAALAAMDVFVLTSRMEGLPNVLIEAQAAGLPIICTGVGGMEETFIEGETGFSVRGATARTLADAVSRLISEPELRRRMSQVAFAHARATFGVETMLDQMSQAYDDQYSRDALRIRKELATFRPPQFHPRTLRHRETAPAEICRA
jgi:glycosyltransferase involved in cell wall biosynthesis